MEFQTLSMNKSQNSKKKNKIDTTDEWINKNSIIQILKLLSIVKSILFPKK